MRTGHISLMLHALKGKESSGERPSFEVRFGRPRGASPCSPPRLRGGEPLLEPVDASICNVSIRGGDAGASNLVPTSHSRPGNPVAVPTCRVRFGEQGGGGARSNSPEVRGTQAPTASAVGAQVLRTTGETGVFGASDTNRFGGA